MKDDINTIDGVLDEKEEFEKSSKTSTSEIPLTSKVYPVVPISIVENTDYFGKYIKKSRACLICTRKDHMDINFMRSREHVPLKTISENINISMEMLEIHFNNHFIISPNIQKIINIKENTSQESRELVALILEGNVDLFAGAQGVLAAKGQRLHFIQQKIKELSDAQELRAVVINTLREKENQLLTKIEQTKKDQLSEYIQNYEEILRVLDNEIRNIGVELSVISDQDYKDIQEFFQMNKLAEEVENSILKTWQIIDKKLFPISREDLSNAILSYKLGVLSKILDDIQIVFVEFEKNSYYVDLIKNLRTALSERFNFLEDSILKSGGILQSVERVKTVPTPAE